MSHDPTKKKTWVIDTETKGTGAQVIPFSKQPPPPAAPVRPQPVGRRRTPLPEPGAAPRAPRRFRAIGVMSRAVLADDVELPELLVALGRVAKVGDVSLFVWAVEAERWRLLTLAEQQAVWKRRTPA